MKKNLLSFVLIAFLTTLLHAQNSTAIYTITFDSNWSQAAHPHSSGNLPGNAHWSKLVGATHTNAVTFLEMGQTATEGMEDVAELGNNTIFFSEVTAAITAGTANQIIDGDGLSTALGQTIIGDVTTTDEFPYLTLVSMIAPSPDWMIAINSVNLLDGSNEWRDSIVIDLFPYDAGTDSGTDYTSPDDDTNPKEPISNLQGVTPFSSEKIGTLTITLENILGISGFDVENSFQVFPNPARESITITAQNNLERVEVYNVLGKKITSVNNINDSELTIDTTEFASGAYVLQAIDENNKAITKKLIKL